jgi:hypothetical protein
MYNNLNPKSQTKSKSLEQMPEQGRLVNKDLFFYLPGPFFQKA